MISILLPDLRGGGAERVNIDLAYEFARLGHQVEFVLMQGKGEFLDDIKNDFSVVSLDTKRMRSVPMALAGYLRARRPDALLVSMWPLTVMAPLSLLLARVKCRLIVSEHNSLSVQYSSWGRLHYVLMRMSMVLGYRLVKRKVAVSQGVARDVASLACLNPDSFTVIHNPVAPPREPSCEEMLLAESLWTVERGSRIITVGSMKEQKNHALIIEAMSKLDIPGAQLMIVGAGSMLEESRRLAERLGVSDKVVFAGFKSNPAPFYYSADLFVLSSNYEGFGNVIVEAMSCGLPVVSTDCPSGPSEILDHGRYGKLVPVRDMQSLMVAIRQALVEPVQKEALLCRAKTFSPEVAGRKYLNLLEIA